VGVGRRVSERRHWESFWGARRDPDQVYPDSAALMECLRRDLDPAGLRVLEVGAGSGRDSVALARAGAEVTVVDYALNALAHVRANAERAGAGGGGQADGGSVVVRRVRADGTRSPFPAGAFDLVLHQGLLEHFRQPQELLADNLRVLRPGGRLYCAVPQTLHAYTLMKQMLIALDRWFAGWETQFTPAGLDACVREAGFRVVGRFGGWMEPSLAYRMLRAAAGAVGVQLPMYLHGPEAWRRMRRRLRDELQHVPAAAWTFLVVGVVAERP
jgi:SAM-dependent methyltransferase